jgi:tetratricopeptide (TPR) repeat protein
MRATMGKIRWVVALAALLLTATPARGQGQQNPPTPPAQPGQPAPPAKPAFTIDSAPPPVNPEEEAAYKTFYELKASDVQRQIQAGEEFLKKYPASRYCESVYSRLTSAYISINDVDRMMTAGEKALELKPDDVDVLALMALVMPRRVNPAALDANQKLDRSEKYAKQSISLLANLPKPAGLSDADFAKAKNEKLSMAHSGLGFVYFHRQKYADSATELEQATKLASTPDPVDYFLLGVVLEQTKRYADAVAAYGHCADVSGVMQARCKQALESARKQAAAKPAPPK